MYSSLSLTAIRSLVALVLLSASLLSGPHGPAHARVSHPITPAGEILVVTANLQEAFGQEDLKDMSEIPVFVDRLLEKVAYLPDVLLLQDVRRRSARYTADVLEQRSGVNYRIVQHLPAEPWRSLSDDTAVTTETAILVNANTIVSQQWAFFRVRNPWPVKNKYTEYKRQAYAGLVERQSGSELGVMSVHLPKAPEHTEATAKRYVPWVRKLASKLAGLHPSAARVIGGDFNQPRCLYDTRPCTQTPFWSTLEDEFEYQEALWLVQQRKHWSERLKLGVDFIFSRQAVVDAGGDEAPPQFYSDHRFFWALVSTTSER